jgi:hypothetical protein
LRAGSHTHLMFPQAYRTFMSLYSTKCLLCSSVKLFQISWKWSIAGQAGDWFRLWVGWAQYPIHVCRGFASQRTQRPRCEIGHSPASSDRVANEWRGTSSPAYVFTSWLLTQSLVVTLFNTSLNTKKILRSAHTLYLCVLCRSQNKQRLYPYTALIDWFL